MDGQIDLVSGKTIDVSILEYIPSMRNEPRIMERLAELIPRLPDYEMYMKQIGGKLKILIPVQYTGNPILEILLTDRTAIMEVKEIVFSIKVDIM